MPVWGWALLIGLTGLVMVGLIGAIVGGTHRLRTRPPAHADVEDISAPLPPDTAHGLDEMTRHEIEAERELDRSREAPVSRGR